MSWSGGYAEWTNGDHAYISVVFSWLLGKATARAAWLEAEGYNVHLGGPAVMLNSEAAGKWADLSALPALSHHNPEATLTTRGCIRKCPFCAVPVLEGDLVELTDWDPKPIVCDNNLLAASRAHFDRVIDSLKGIPDVDFNQGLDARLLSKYHADELARLDLACIRLAWDDVRLESTVMKAIQHLRNAHIPKDKIRAYVLIGWRDTPDDALYRLETLRSLRLKPNPMRYQPIHTERRNQYVGPGWTHGELVRFMRYWSNLRVTGSIPFREFGREPAGSAGA